ncbi:MAG: type II secretion system GspH family protein [Planctomycetes bacterium]|nr:type II secretion system GspH family protein [Planctomycetota bacterium]
MRSSNAFTLIELLVVISIIAILAAMLLPAISLVKASARTMSCSSSMRQLSMSVLGYAGDNQGQLPPSRFQNCAPAELGFTAGSTATWLHPNLAGGYLEAGKELLGDFIPGTAPFSAPFRCPEDRTRKGSSSANGVSYGLNFYQAPYADLAANLPTLWSSIRSLGQYGRTSSVLLIGESHEARLFPINIPGGWPNCPMYANDVVTSWGAHPSPNNPMARHRRGSNFGYLDGHMAWVGDLTAEVTARRTLLGRSWVSDDY